MDVISPRISCAGPCISSDYPIHIDTIRMELSILYLKLAKISIKIFLSCRDVSFWVEPALSSG